MSRFGWAYVNGLVTGSATAAGPTNSVQYNSGSGVFSGSSNFTFNPVTNTLTVVGTISASVYQGVSGSGGSTSPGGTNTTVQFNSGSTFSGSSNLTYNYTTNVLSLTGTTLISGSLTATNTITATSASFLDYVQLGTSLSDEAYFNASLKTNIQPAATNDVDLGASSRFWKTGYITTLSSSAISSSVNIKTGEITATSIVLNGNLSSSGNINGSGLQIAGSGQFGGTVTVTGSVSSSVGLQTAGAGQFGNGVTVTGTISSSVGLQTAGTLTVGSNAIIKNGLVVTGTVNASSFVGDGNNITGINGANVNGVGNDWTIHFKDGNTGTLTSSANLTFTGSTLYVTGSVVATSASFDVFVLNRTTITSNTTLTSNKHIIGVATSTLTASVTISLPNASTLPNGKHYIIKDEDGNANVRNIIVSCSVVGQTIDGNSSVTANSPYAALNIYCDGTSKYFIY